jgi:hypothetical protein
VTHSSIPSWIGPRVTGVVTFDDPIDVVIVERASGVIACDDLEGDEHAATQESSKKDHERAQIPLDGRAAS